MQSTSPRPTESCPPAQSHSPSPQARLSYGTDSPVTPNGDKLFYRAPASTPSTPSSKGSARAQASTRQLESSLDAGSTERLPGHAVSQAQHDQPTLERPAYPPSSPGHPPTLQQPASSYRGESLRLDKALAALPWATPPPRQPSPLAPRVNVSSLSTPSSPISCWMGVPTSYFPPTHTNRPADKSVTRPPAARLASHANPPAPAPHRSAHARSAPNDRGSLQSHDRHVDFANSTFGHGMESEISSLISVMAGYSSSSGTASLRSSSSASVAHSRLSRSRSIGRSNIPGRSPSARSKRSERGSGGTPISHTGYVKLGQWEIRQWEDLELDLGLDGGSGAGLPGSASTATGGGKREYRGRARAMYMEESMDLSSLVGRAAVLERVLRSGKRVGGVARGPVVWGG
ncbi:hypothetical protein IAU60_001884 [Kwoniella sp. DSM 27419]